MVFTLSTKRILQLLLIVSWIIFVGLSIEAGGFLFNTIYSNFYQPLNANNFWNGVNLSSLYEYDRGFYAVFTGLVCIVAILKALMFYMIIKLLSKDEFLDQLPFNAWMKKLIQLISYISFGIALFSHWSIKYSKWFIQQGVQMPDLQELKLASGDVWLFLGIIMLIISQIINRGIELQKESDLTI
jgi:hypothetical protein